MIIEESKDGFKSTDYKGYKPYSPAPKGYDWRDYVTLNESGDGIVSCHMCDIRESGCSQLDDPRYYCKKDEVDMQSSLFDF